MMHNHTMRCMFTRQDLVRSAGTAPFGPLAADSSW
jgi:hypothetical protein